MDLNKVANSKQGQYAIIGGIIGAAVGLLVGGLVPGLIIGGVAGYFVSKMNKKAL